MGKFLNYEVNMEVSNKIVNLKGWGKEFYFENGEGDSTFQNTRFLRNSQIVCSKLPIIWNHRPLNINIKGSMFETVFICLSEMK